MKHGIAASTPKKLEVKPTALGILLDAQGAIGGLARAYTRRDDSGEEWLESWFTRRTQFHFAPSIPEDEPIARRSRGHRGRWRGHTQEGTTREKSGWNRGSLGEHSHFISPPVFPKMSQLFLSRCHPPMYYN